MTNEEDKKTFDIAKSNLLYIAYPFIVVWFSSQLNFKLAWLLLLITLMFFLGMSQSFAKEGAGKFHLFFCGSFGNGGLLALQYVFINDIIVSREVIFLTEIGSFVFLIAGIIRLNRGFSRQAHNFTEEI